MSPWWAIVALGAVGLVIFVASYLGYRARVAWYEEYDRKHPGVAEKLGVRSRVKKETT